MSQVTHVTTSNFDQEVLKSPTPVLVDFYATWCPPCKMLAPHLDRLAQEFNGRARIVKVNVDEEPQLAMQYKIQHVPTLILFDEGKQLDHVDPNPPTIHYRLAGLCMA